MKTITLSAGLAAAGLFAGALAWAAHQQTSYIIAAFACGHGGAPIWCVGAAAVVVLGAGALTSWLIVRGRPRSAAAPDSDHTLRFLAMLGLMGAGLFLFAIALQACAVLFLAPCLS